MGLPTLQNLTKIYKNGIRTKMKNDIIFKEYYRDDEIVLRAVELSEKVLDKMNAIKIAARLIGESSPDSFVYIIRMLPIGKELREFFTKDIYGKEVNVPAFIWRFRGRDGVDSFILECEHDYTLKYPVKKVTVSQTDSDGQVIYEANETLVADEYLIHNEERFIEHLNKILETM